MDFSQLNLKQKGLIIVMPPVVFSLIFLGVLSWLLVDAEKQYEKRRAYIEFQMWSHKTKSLLGTSLSQIVFGLEADDGEFLKDSVRLKFELDRAIYSIKHYISKRPEEKEQLSGLLDLCVSGKRLLSKAEKVYKDESIPPSKRPKYLRGEFNLLMLEAQPRFYALSKKEIEKVSSKSVLYANSPLIMIWLVLGFVVNGLLTWRMVSLFNSSLVARIAHLREQSQRMAAGVEPLEIGSGADELTELESRLIEASEALEQRRKRERAILDNADEVICSVDINKRFRTVGYAIEKLLGYETDELLGKLIVEILFDKSKNQFLKQLDLVKVQGGKKSVEVFIRKKNGSKLPASCTISFDTENDTWLCVVRDISERKKLQKTKERFIATISHDIRSPLASISNSIQLLLEGARGPIPDKVSIVFERVKSSISKLMNLAEDLLEIERLESGKLVMESQYVSTYDVCVSAQELVESFAQKRDIRINSDLTDIGALGDEKRIVHVIVNLLSNAIKFSNSNSEIELKAKRTGEFAEISVSDYGQGIAEEDLDFIFERFGQAKQADKTAYKSSGLGLAICKGIVEGMSGEIGVESELEKGSRFWIRLPLFSVESEEPDNA